MLVLVLLNGGVGKYRHDNSEVTKSYVSIDRLDSNPEKGCT